MMTSYSIYTCANKDCPKHNKELSIMHFRAYRTATGKSPKCGECGELLKWVKDDGDRISATESINERCENCEFVDRDIDEYCHEVYWVSNRCPTNEILTAYRKINRRNCPIELMTGYTGCIRFKEDAEYKRKKEETELFLKELHARKVEGIEGVKS